MNDRDQMLAKLKEVLVEQTDLADEVTPETHFVNDLNFDSLEAVEFVMSVEEVFDVSIADEEADDIKTVGDVMDLLTKLQTPA